MKRNISIDFLAWKNKAKRKPLIVQGARQTGKTFYLKEFCNKHFKQFYYFDLEERKIEFERLFNTGSLEYSDILKRLSFIAGSKINPEDDLIVFDEIQAVPRALTALKYMQSESSSNYIIAAGSNLGVAFNSEPFPVGKVEIIEVFPLTFEEFLAGTDETAALEFISNFSGGITDDLYHNKLFELLKTFFITGGMPEAITTYRDNKDNQLEAFTATRKIQKQILLHYEHDFGKYSGATNSRHLARVFQSVPQQLSITQDSRSAKFKFKEVLSKGSLGFEQTIGPIDWLIKAGLILKVNLNDHPAVPILARADETKFKLFLFDTGLLGAMTGLSPESIINYDYGSYKGFFAENYALQELYAHKINQIISWSGRLSEIEFVTELNGQIIPIEVKAGNNTKAKSLNTFMEKYAPEYGIKFSGNKFGYNSETRIYNIPLYLISKFPALCINKN